MKTSFTLYLLLLITVAPLCHAEPDALAASDRKVLEEEGRFREVRTKSGLPKAILDLCTDGGGAMAEPGQPFQVTDVVTDATLPGRRLSWGAISGDYYVVHYETGGIAHVYRFLVATMPKGAAQPKVLWREAGNVKCDDYKAFVEALRNHKFDSGRR